MSKFHDLVSGNLLATIGIVLGSFVAVVIIVVIIGILVYCCCCKRRRNGYHVITSRHHVTSQGLPNVTTLEPSSHVGPGNQEEGLYEAMQRQRKEQENSRKETALLNCQYYLRSNHKYILETHLPDIGSRMSKDWFLVRPVGRPNVNSVLLTMVPISQQCQLNLQGGDKHVLKQLLSSLEHPYVHNFIDIDYIPDKRLVVIMEPFCQRGSLKDLIYHTTPSMSWSTKYSVRRSGLRLNQVQSLGRQVLEAISFLHNLDFCPIGQIQSGNVYLEGSRCKLSGFDNSILGYKPRIQRLTRQFQTNIDSALFGHLIYELGSGRELTVPRPSDNDLGLVQNTQVNEVLKFIFWNENGDIPTIAEIMDHPFFSGVKTSQKDHWSHDGVNVKLDQDMKSLLERSRRGKPRSSSSAGKKKPRTSSESRYPVFDRTSSLLPTIEQSPPPYDTSKITNTTSTNIEMSTRPVEKDVPPTETKDHSRLLIDIRTGTSLRQTVTNDRSAPMI